MARRRQARRCGASRSDGSACRAWAILGGAVCAAHGGSAPQVRAQATLRHWETVLDAAYARAYATWRRELAEWQARRLAAASLILGVAPAEVTEGELLWLAAGGQIPGEDAVPRIRVDRRYGPRMPAQLATRAARQAALRAEA